MSWLQQVVGKLKSLFGRKDTQGDAALPAASTETPVADKPATPVTVTEEKPAPASSVVTEEPADAKADEEPAEAEIKAELDTDEPVATPAVTSEVATPEADVPAPAEPEVAPEPVVASVTEADEPAAEVSEPAVAEEPEPRAADAEPAKREATNPAISTLDVEALAVELQSEGPYGPGSSKPAAGGAAPSADFTVKGKESSKLFHTEKSPYFSRTKADVWFKSEADAESAGFQAWDHKKRTAAKK